mmetsp:Transcript_20446/g.36688  ORF Transcript_20446/g.36688 Transcript_20446/m.36688 type:complete len:112 (-) Transcript_20446:722-1057(-)
MRGLKIGGSISSLSASCMTDHRNQKRNAVWTSVVNREDSMCPRISAPPRRRSDIFETTSRHAPMYRRQSRIGICRATIFESIVPMVNLTSHTPLAPLDDPEEGAPSIIPSA